jgi:hypothetical protein
MLVSRATMWYLCHVQRCDTCVTCNDVTFLHQQYLGWNWISDTCVTWNFFGYREVLRIEIFAIAQISMLGTSLAGLEILEKRYLWPILQSNPPSKSRVVQHRYENPYRWVAFPPENPGRDNIGMKIPICELARVYAIVQVRGSARSYVSRSHALTSQWRDRARKKLLLSFFRKVRK